MRLRKRSYEIDMLNGPVLPKLISFALPLMLSSVLQLTFNAADVIVVGRFEGDAALAAVGTPGSLINLLVNLFMGLSVGANVVVAQCYGAGNFKDTREAVHTSVTLSLIGGVLVGIVGFFLAGTFLSMMNTPAEVLPWRRPICAFTSWACPPICCTTSARRSCARWGTPAAR